MIIVVSDIESPRLVYVLDFIFNDIFGQQYLIKTSCDSSDNLVLYYGDPMMHTETRLHIPHCGLLDTIRIDAAGNELILSEVKRCSTWLSDVDASCPDLFSIIFYCLSRYEEYIAQDRDEHGRCSGRNSILFDLGWVERPLVDEILHTLSALVYKKYGFRLTKSKKYSFKSTLDIDQPWAYKYKGWESLLGLGKDLILFKWQRIKSRFLAITGIGQDPFDTYDYIKDVHDKYGISPVFFILAAAQKSKNDRNHSINSKAYKQLINNFFSNFEIGIHPSYRSNTDYQILKDEVLKLEEVSGKTIKSSRQHFLKMELPTTYQHLIKAGIITDYSMGYADCIGYRAGTGHEFYWYDISCEKQTSLRVHPLVVMDGTLNFYMRLTPQSAKSKVLQIMEVSKKLDSPFCILWHNSSFDPNYGWDDWASVYEVILAHANKP